MKYWILGFGEIAITFIKLLKIEKIFCSEDWCCIECDKNKKHYFVELGGNPNNFFEYKITKKNYINILEILHKGEYLIDFSSNINSKEILKYCLSRRIHYLSIADSFWNNENEEFGKSFLEYLHIKKNTINLPTSIIEFGMNPGLVSIFAKQCLKNIVYDAKDLFVQKNQNELLKKLYNSDYASIVKKLGIRKVKIVDIDTQIVNLKIEPNTIYSPWNCEAFYHEAIINPEVPLSIPLEKKYLNLVTTVENMNYRLLKHRGIDSPDKVIIEDTEKELYIMSHEETFSLSYLFSYKKNNRIIYRPEVTFIYKPSNISLESIKNTSKTYKSILIHKNQIVDGGEYVGVLFQGKNISDTYYGNYCTETPFECSATVFQVALSCYAAFQYMLNNQNNGLLFPEDLDEDFILSIIKKYLELKLDYKFISKNTIK